MKVIAIMTILLNTAYGAAGIVAHRGASGYAPENTISAIKKAIDLKSEFVEVDVQMTKDGQIVVIHDLTVDRTSNGEGEVKNLTLKELQAFDAGSWFNSKFTGEKIPSLEDILKLDYGESKLILEVKNVDNLYPGIEETINRLVEKYNFQSKVVYKSFTPEVLKRFEELAPKTERLYVTIGSVLGFLVIDDWLRFGSLFDVENIQYLQVHRFLVSKRLIKKCQKKGIKLIVWDVHDKVKMRKYERWGVDLIETDFPDYLDN